MGAGPGLTLGPLVPSLVCVDWQNESIVLSQCLDLRRAQGQHSHPRGPGTGGACWRLRLPLQPQPPRALRLTPFPHELHPSSLRVTRLPWGDFFSGTEDPDWEEDFAPGFRHSAAVRLSKSLNSLRLVSLLYQ